MFDVASVPPIHCRPGCLAEIGQIAASIAPASDVLLIGDPWLNRNGVTGRVVQDLEANGLSVWSYYDLAGEPTASDVRTATEMARGTALVIGIGGGSALDIAKTAAACGKSCEGSDPIAYACAARPLPDQWLPKILVPTTAGTGAESSSTAIFSGEDGRKLWLWGEQTKAERVLLDPELTLTLPPSVTAACAMDAFVHAFEAATNRRTHAGAQLYAHSALRLIAPALPRAVADPQDLSARTDLLLGACYAGVAIDNCGTAVAHMISHALAGLVPVSHGLATALAFEATLPWLVDTPTPDMNAAAHALGLGGTTDLPGYTTHLMDAADMARRLPFEKDAVSLDAFDAAMRAPENAPMREATARPISEADTRMFATQLLSLARDSHAPKALTE
ncbi:MAG: iron-containing alcohol dehydrogenase [Pseudomonadota bacterium]